jgi:hypothetical protein
MEKREYKFRVARLVKPGLTFAILYPLALWLLVRVAKLPARYGQLFTIIFIVTAIIVALIIIVSHSQKVLIEGDNVVFRSMLGSEILEPKDIRRVTFRRVRKYGELAQIRTARKMYLLSDYYFPQNELFADVEGIIVRNQIKSNLDRYNTEA